MAQFSNGEGGDSVRTKINAAIATVDGIGTGDNLLLTQAERDKLLAIEALATADQTGTEIVASIDAELGTTDWKTGGGGSTTFLGLTDVPDTAVEGDIPVYRAGTFVFEAKPASGGNPALTDVSDVTITTPGDNALLSYDTTSATWINQTAAEAGLALTLHTHTLADISDYSAADYATAAQGALADSAVQPSAEAGNNLTSGAKAWGGTQAAYDAIGTKDANTLYFVAG